MPTRLSCRSPDQVGRLLGGVADKVSEESKWLMGVSPGCGIRAGPIGSAPSSARATEPGAGDTCKAVPASNSKDSAGAELSGLLGSIPLALGAAGRLTGS